jgi:hypothetical protein
VRNAEFVDVNTIGSDPLEGLNLDRERSARGLELESANYVTVRRNHGLFC